MSSYSDAFSPSFGNQVFVNDSGAALTGSKFGSSLDSVFQNPQFGVDTAGQFNSVADALTGLGALSGASSQGWTFITAPEDVSWDVANQAQRIDIFGTNNPPVVAGSRGMRDLNLGNALVEGFVRNVTVEGKVAALEGLMQYGLNETDGYVKVPVYQVWANQKAYGNGYFIIKDVKIKETMRDLKGDATRAFVDVSFMEVPAYQVDSGRDLASQPAAAAKAMALPDPKATRAAQQASVQTSAATTANQGVGTASKPASGAGAGGATKPEAAVRPAAVIPGKVIPYAAPPR
jgi:hypothetical protein